MAKRHRTYRRRRHFLKKRKQTRRYKGGAWSADRIPNDAVIIRGKQDDDFVPQLSTMEELRSSQEN